MLKLTENNYCDFLELIFSEESAFLPLPKR